MSTPELEGQVSPPLERWTNKIFLPAVAYALLGALLFLDLPSLFRSVPGAAPSRNTPTLSNQPLSGGISTSQPSGELIGQNNAHMLIQGWFSISDPKLSLRRIVLLLDDKPLAEASVFNVNVDPSGQKASCEWRQVVYLSGVEAGTHRVEAVALLADGRSVPFDGKNVMVWD